MGSFVHLRSAESSALVWLVLNILSSENFSLFHKVSHLLEDFKKGKILKIGELIIKSDVVCEQYLGNIEWRNISETVPTVIEIGHDSNFSSIVKIIYKDWLETNLYNIHVAINESDASYT